MENEANDWWEISVAWKWPHEGFTVGYDLIEPIEEDEAKYFSFKFIFRFIIYTC